MEESTRLQEESKQPPVNVVDESLEFNAEDKLQAVNILSKVGMVVFCYLLVRLVYCTILTAAIIDEDTINALKFVANLSNTGSEFEELLSTMKAIPRNGIIASTVGLLFSVIGYYMTRIKKVKVK